MSGSYLTPSIEHARVSDAMRHGLCSCPVNASLRQAARTMASHHVHSVVVSDPDNGAVVGIVSDGALLRALLDGRDGEALLREAVETEVTTIGSDEPLVAAAELMRDRELAHLLVCDAESGLPTGMLSTLDVAGILAWGEA